jgi:hypothetical protein
MITDQNRSSPIGTTDRRGCVTDQAASSACRDVPKDRVVAHGAPIRRLRTSPGRDDRFGFDDAACAARHPVSLRESSEGAL